MSQPIMNINEIKTKVVQRFIRALGRYIKKYSWIIYLNVIIGVVGYSIDSWEYWVITIPTILLQSLANTSKPTMTELYRKKKAQPMMPYNPEVGMPKCVSISDADKAKGSPKLGDMIAINPNDINDMWLVAKEFFEENYEKIPSGEHIKTNYKHNP